MLPPELVISSTCLALMTGERLLATVQTSFRIPVVVPELVLVDKQLVYAWVNGVVSEWLVIVFLEAKVSVPTNRNRPRGAD